MIPTKLSLHNFMSYGDGMEPLDFSPIHTASLVGLNGHGKSAILDAITWVLWGKARSSTDSLVRMGSSDMRVELEFELEDILYRVNRGRSITGSRPHSTLELFVRSGEGGKWQALTGESIRDTERKIVAILRMDYDTFINSAFILQGRADEFTVKNSSERKKVLGDILGLGIYDDLEALARDHAREEKSKVGAIDEALQDATTQMARKEDYRGEIKRLQGEIEKISGEIEILEQEKGTLSDSRAVYLSKESQLEDLEGQLLILADELVRNGEQISGQERHVAEIEKVLAEKDFILESFDKLSKAKRRDDELDRTQAEHNRLRQAKSELQRVVDGKTHALEIERNSLSSELSRLYDEKREYERITQERGAITEGHDELMKTRTLLISLDDRRNRLRQLEGEKNVLENKIKDEKHKLQIKINSFRERYDEMGRKVALAEGLHADREGITRTLKSLTEIDREREAVREEGLENKNKMEALEGVVVSLREEVDEKEKSIDLITGVSHCPLCDQKLFEAERETVRAKYSDELSTLQRQLTQNVQETRTYKDHASELREQYILLGKQIEEKVDLEKKLAELSVLIAQAHEAKAEMELASSTLSEMEGMIVEGRFSPKEKASLEGVVDELKELDYDEDYHLKIREKAEKLTPFELKKAELDSAQTKIAAMGDRIPDLERELVDKEELIETRTYVSKEDTELARIEEQLRDLNYREDIHSRVKEELESLSWVQEKKILLDQAERSIQDEVALLNRMVSDQEGKEKRRTELNSQRDTLEVDLKEGVGILERIEKMDVILKEKQETRLVVREQLGISREKLEQCMRLERESQDKLKERSEADYEGAIYNELSEAFGKKGIQAVIIENVIPLLEREANEILRRMTDNRMHVTIETQREKKDATGVVETLDIKISDELGTRDYELYSGGEAFRVNFAIRIALSKLLAERAGAKLRTLVIDEGFGTQDGEGRERLVDALRTIEKDFDKIIVVTHIPELKDAFPARIEVSKSPEVGSRYEVFYN